jgi:hypothetical protein
MTALLVFFIGILAWAQPFQYELEGSFKTHDEATVNYTLTWNETSEEIQGLYRDNYYVQTGPTIVSGEVSSSGRNMKVILPKEVHDVRSLSFATAHTATASASIPLKVTTRDNVGGLLHDERSFGLLEINFLDAVNDEDACNIGFGALSGYCGIYSGMMNEYSDEKFNCNLLSSGTPRLEVAADTSVRLLIPNSPAHDLGALFPSPQTTQINLTRQHCGELYGVSAPSNNCKTLILTGVFIKQGLSITYSGNYSIIDEVTNNMCSYNLTFSRENF